MAINKVNRSRFYSQVYSSVVRSRDTGEAIADIEFAGNRKYVIRYFAGPLKGKREEVAGYPAASRAAITYAEANRPKNDGLTSAEILEGRFPADPGIH